MASNLPATRTDIPQSPSGSRRSSDSSQVLHIPPSPKYPPPLPPSPLSSISFAGLSSRSNTPTSMTPSTTMRSYTHDPPPPGPHHYRPQTYDDWLAVAQKDGPSAAGRMPASGRLVDDKYNHIRASLPPARRCQRCTHAYYITQADGLTRNGNTLTPCDSVDATLEEYLDGRAALSFVDSPADTDVLISTRCPRCDAIDPFHPVSRAHVSHMRRGSQVSPAKKGILKLKTLFRIPD
ncbi:hypothetical protein CYLTODRAFT_447053 [Cylindrobasidium torrendii FP15055 ss-10]|uniref:Uncharacterized protein n=1 Tax=Cylindrobasidium torrendii FP15055 ss-10 TaxID=1314674 RepID=A0A0D7AXT8_9AGAR|nr:hypothetical protein CYLTODRAFT_447053 [Cylindrobasidium torrendii FP15055 ss-10]